MTDSDSSIRVAAQPTGVRGRDRRHLRPGRARRIAPTFTEQESAEIAAAAAAAGLTATGFCAEAALTVARGMTTSELNPDRETFARLQAELFDAVVAVNRIGTNLNKGVAAFNATGAAPPWLGRAVLLCERRMALLDAVVSQVHRRLR